MKAYLLAAGYATRMRPLTEMRPKPLLEVAGAPILSHIAREVLRLEGLSEVVVIANDRFARHFASWQENLDADVPVRVLYDGTPGKRPAVPVRLALEAELVGEGCSAQGRYDEAR